MNIDEHVLKERLVNSATKEIEQWMKERYPDFGSSLLSRYADLEKKCKELDATVQSLSANARDNFVDWSSKIREEILKVSNEEAPNVFKRLENLTGQYESRIKNLNEFINQSVKNTNSLFDLNKEKITKELDSIIEKDHPAFKIMKEAEKDIGQLKKLYKESVSECQQSCEEINKLHQKLNNLRKSSSVFEDLYSIRDEVHDIKIQFNSFKKGLTTMFSPGISIDLDTPLSDFPWSVRASNTLSIMEVETVEQLIKIPDSELLKVRNMGKKTLQEIQKFRDEIFAKGT